MNNEPLTGSNQGWAKLTEGLILAALPVIGSLVAFGFEAGYLGYFGIPFEYAEVTFQRIVVAILVTGSPLLLIFVSFSYGYSAGVTKSRTHSAARRMLIVILLSILIFILMMNLLATADERLQALNALIGTLLSAIAFVLGVTLVRSMMLHQRVMREQPAAEKQSHQFLIESTKRQAKIALLSLLFAVVSMALSIFGGYSAGYVKKDFWFIE